MKINRLKLLDSVRLYAISDTIPPVELTVTWSTPAGKLPDASTTTPYSTTLLATASDSSAVSYSTTGLPLGLTLNSSTGVISGTVEDSGATFNFVVRASVGPFFADRSFSIDTFGPPEWVTPQGRLGIVAQDETFNYSLLAQ